MNKEQYTTKSRTAAKDALMRTIIYGGGFVVKGTLSIIASAFGIPPGAIVQGKRTARNVQDQAWETYCKEGDMKEGLKNLFE